MKNLDDKELEKRKHQLLSDAKRAYSYFSGENYDIHADGIIFSCHKKLDSEVPIQSSQLHFVTSLMKKTLDVFDAAVDSVKKSNVIILGSLARMQLEILVYWNSYLFAKNKENFIKQINGKKTPKELLSFKRKNKIENKYIRENVMSDELKEKYSEYCKYVHNSEKIFTNCIKIVNNQKNYCLDYNNENKKKEAIMIFEEINDIASKLCFGIYTFVICCPIK